MANFGSYPKRVGLAFIVSLAAWTSSAWSHGADDTSNNLSRDRQELDLKHRDLVRLNEKLNQLRKAERAPPLPSGVKIVSVGDVNALLATDEKNRTGQDKRQASGPASGINKSSCMQKSFSQVSWIFCVTDMGKKSLWVGPVFIQRSPTDAWHKLVALAGMADIFVPYDNANFRPYDLQWITRLNTVGASEAGPNGSVITLSNETTPTVVIENRDAGISLLCHQNPNIVKRSQEIVVWGVADGGNYDNIIEYGFRDDGVMTFRLGNTGYADPSNQRGRHTHNGLWRVDIDVNGSANDSAFLQSHIETQGSAADLSAAISYESSFQFNAQNFTSLLVTDAAFNANGNRLGYEFVPRYTGNSRHYEPNELWTQNDIHVSKYRQNELGWVADPGTTVQTIPESILGTGWADPDHYLLTQLSPPEYIASSDLVVWVKTSFRHNPTDEENKVISPPNSIGVTSTHWSGFDLMPHNFFDSNPLSPNMTCNHP